MKICWDNLEKLRFNKKTGKWYLGNNTYIYISECKICKEPYLANLKSKNKWNDCCSEKCSKNNPETIKKANKTRHEKIKSRIFKSRFKQCPNCKDFFLAKRKEQVYCEIFCMGDYRSKNYIKDNSTNWKGGVFENNLAIYDTFFDKFCNIEEVRRDQENNDLLNVKCSFCGEWIRPNRNDAYRRISYINGLTEYGEARFYCDNGECKRKCDVFATKKYPKSHQKSKSDYNQYRCNQSRVRKALLDIQLDTVGYTYCEKCGNEKQPEELFFHHNVPIADDPNEYDNAAHYMIVCAEHHKHEGCLNK